MCEIKGALYMKNTTSVLLSHSCKRVCVCVYVCVCVHTRIKEHLYSAVPYLQTCVCVCIRECVSILRLKGTCV